MKNKGKAKAKLKLSVVGYKSIERKSNICKQIPLVCLLVTL